ncbi:MAG: type IV pilin protein [Myxococcota bacterium]
MRRGFTLVELMITVAVLGLVGVLFDTLAGHIERTGLAELQRERARLLVEYHARQRVAHRDLDLEIDRRLRADLPGVELSEQSTGGTVTITVRWTAPTGPAPHLSLTLVAEGAR